MYLMSSDGMKGDSFCRVFGVTMIMFAISDSGFRF